MNRLIIYRITIAISAFLMLISIFGAFTFTLVELLFYVSSILIVFSFEKKPTDDLDKPQVHQYVTNRLNYYNYFAAGGVITFITLYVVLKYLDLPRALLYLYVCWILASFALQYIYKYTSLRKLKYSLSDYLIMISTKEPKLRGVTGEQIIQFVDAVVLNGNTNIDVMLKEISKKTGLSLDESTLLHELAEEYLELTEVPLKSSELP
jgi:hypothetical protein